MRYRDRLDCALLLSDAPATAAGVFTRNRFCAAPVALCREHLEASAGTARAVLINAGIANACTGEEGVHRARRSARAVADRLGVDPTQVLVASTGVIGPQIRVDTLEAVLPDLAGQLAPGGWENAARAIMTTDTVPKTAWAQRTIGGKTVTAGGIAKGSGMIAPDMATMLAFVVTDAAVSTPVLQVGLRRAADRTFNRITVDGDTSTNDTVLALASGAAGNAPIQDPHGPGAHEFFTLLTAVCADLAQQIVRDGEGATKFVVVRVQGARTRDRATQVARTVAQSPLVKTALFGQDANWGRVVAAAGRAGVDFDPERVSLRFGQVSVFEKGRPLEDPTLEARASQVLRQKDIEMVLDLGEGEEEDTYYTCDFSYDYVKINADYRS